MLRSNLAIEAILGGTGRHEMKVSHKTHFSFVFCF